MADEPYYVSENVPYSGDWTKISKAHVYHNGIPVSDAIPTAEARGWVLMLNKAYREGFEVGYRKGCEVATEGGIYS